uniref:Transcriptional regulator ATRX homolog n=1 Tax=Saccoglossus kowalevskii TaxID=10224 RepID=A0ABM0MR31_SACKO|nr:PREDICTED: transcriptional regulator ATRX homolog [Saccoglossus kowalevskii]
MEVVSETFTPKSYLIYENKQGPGTMKSDKLRTKVSKKVDIKTLGSCDDSGNDSSGSADTDDICTVTKKSFLVDVMSTSEKKKKKTKLDSMSTVKKTPVKPFMDNEEKKSETKKNKKILASMPTPTTCEEQIKVNSKMDIVDENNKTSTRKVDTETKKRSKKRKSEKIDGNKLKSEKTAKTLDSSRAKCDTSTILNNNEHGRNTDSGTCDSLVDHTKILDKTEQNISKLPLTLKGLTTTPGWAADVELPKQKPSIMDFYDSDDFVDEDDDLFDRLDVDKSLKQRLEVMSSLKSNEKKKTSEDVALEVVSEKYTPKYRYRLFFGSTEGSEIKTDKTRTRTSTEGDIKKQGFLIDSGDDSTGSADTDDICTVADTPRMVLFNMDEVMSTSKKKPKKKQIDSVATDQSFQNTPVKVIGNHEGKKSETKKKKKMGYVNNKLR